MTWSPDGSITGSAISGFTTPTFTQVDDTAPAMNAKQKTVTAVSGTGTATANTADKPFTGTFYKPAVMQGLPKANPVTGLRGAIPNNQYKFIVRKGGEVASGVPANIVGRLTIDIPAGMESYQPDQIKAFVSYLIGILTEESNDLAETLTTGVL